MTSTDKKSSRKEYLYGISLLVILSAIALWLVQADWADYFTDDVSTEATDFIDAGPFRVAVTVSPETPRVGRNAIVIQVKDQENQPVSGAEVRAVGEMAAMGAMPAMYAQADISETMPGVYRGEFELSMAGEWPLAVDIETDEAHHVDLTFDMATGRNGIRLSTATPEGDTAYHTCSMHPSVKSAEPGTCPICSMDLIAVTHEELQSGVLVVDEGRRQTIGVKTGKVVREPFEVPIRLQGEITYDQTRLSDISMRFDGWIGDLQADFEGKPVRRGDVLFTVYSPELLTLQEEYLVTMKRSGGGAQRQALIAAARKKLQLWGINDAQVRWLEQQAKARDYLPIIATSDAVIIEKHIVAGSAFKEGERLLRLADLSQVWIETYAYEQDLPLIKPGMDATVRLPNLPGRDLTATVMQIDPFLGADTRTARVRLLLDNPSGRYKPGLFAGVTLHAALGNLLLIPEDAVLVSGEKRIVFVDLGGGRLKPTLIRTGYSDGQRVVVRRGLSEGDSIVISGNFLIAAESKLKSGIDQW